MKKKFKLNRIGIKAIDRGGSNLILALFHYHDRFFSLSEKVVFDTTDPENYPRFADPNWATAMVPASARGKKPVEKNDVALAEWLFLQNCSIFHADDFHIKDIKNVRNIVQKIPRETTHASGNFRYYYNDFKYDKVFCVLRNPFRVAISSYNKWYKTEIRATNYCHRCGADVKQELLNKLLDSSIKWTNERLREIKSGDIDNFICLEYFINNFETELPKLIKWADKDTSPIISRNIGRLYFDPAAPEPTGRGKVYAGNFDPLQTIEIDRLISSNINQYFTESAIMSAREKLPHHLFEYWYNDLSHSYKVNLNLI